MEREIRIGAGPLDPQENAQREKAGLGGGAATSKAAAPRRAAAAGASAGGALVSSPHS